MLSAVLMGMLCMAFAHESCFSGNVRLFNPSSFDTNLMRRATGWPCCDASQQQPSYPAVARVRVSA